MDIVAPVADYTRTTGLIAKRVLDVAVSLVGLLVLWPLMLPIAVSIRLDSSGPVFFNVPRVGRKGREFCMYKFRSMVSDAEDRLKGLQHLNGGGNLLVKIPNDPRVTRVGRVMRKTGLDELPQLLNVLKGEMSLVGPRPQYPREVGCYTELQKRRLEVLPGMTGLWQISARDSCDFNEWVYYDLKYIENWSFWLDLKILLMTVPATLKRTSK